MRENSGNSAPSFCLIEGILGNSVLFTCEKNLIPSLSVLMVDNGQSQVVIKGVLHAHPGIIKPSKE